MAEDSAAASFDYDAASRQLWKAGWFSWWSQLILSVVSAVILLFATGVKKVTMDGSFLLNSALPTASICVSALSICWVWGYTRLALAFNRQALEPDVAALKLKKKLRTGIVLNLIGMALAILGAQQIIGTLAAKSFSAGLQPALVAASNSVQPLDIFLVQANTNTILSHFMGLLSSLWISERTTS